MIKHLTKWASALLFAASLAGNAQAMTYDVGTLGPGPVSLTHWVTGSFQDIINFSIEAPNNVTKATVLQIPLDEIWNIDSFNAALYDSADHLIRSWTVGSPTTVRGFLDAGDYYLKLTGNANGNFGGMYNVTAAAMVPEPGEWAMMLAGIGMIGAMVRRRRRV